MVQENKDVRLIGWRKHIRIEQYISRDRWGYKYLHMETVCDKEKERRRKRARVRAQYVLFFNVQNIYIFVLYT